MPDAHQEDIAKLEGLYAEHPEGRIFTHLAEAYRKAGELDRAAHVLGEGIQRHPDYSSAHVVLGRVLVDQGRADEADAAFNRVLELDPHNLVALRARGDLARAGGRRHDAIEHYRRLLDVEPNDDELRALVAGLVADEYRPEPEAPAYDEVEQTAPEAYIPEPFPGEATPAEPAHGEGDHSEADSAEVYAADLPDADRYGHDQADDHDDIGFVDEEADSSAWEMGPIGGADEAQPDDEAPVSPGTDAGLTTETIAQVYARQGLYTRAADVYRELVRANPDDDRLRDRLGEMERLAAPAGTADAGEPLTPSRSGRPEESEVADPWGSDLETTHFDAGDADVAPLSDLESDDIDGETGLSVDALPGEDRAIEPEPEGEPTTDRGVEPGATADPWGASVTGPEVAGSEDGAWTDPDSEWAPEAAPRDEPAPAGEADFDRDSEAQGPAEEVSVWVGDDWTEAEAATPYAWSERAAEETEAEADASEPIGSYFQSILGWTPGHGDRTADRAEEAEQEPAPDTPSDGPEWEPVSEEGDEAPGMEQGTGTDPAGQAGTSESGSGQDDEGQDDDDLDTFRSWLESLKH
jgi:tetratricopeptide (TPR) repeat protein